MLKAEMTHPPQKIPMETFTRDLWEAMRSESREQLGDAVTDQEFDGQLPPWEKLPAEVRAQKITIAHDELLAVLDRAGYEVRKKGRT